MFFSSRSSLIISSLLSAMLQTDGNASDDDLGASMDSQSSPVSLLRPSTSRILEQEFSCHCCYDILVDPTTLTCGHNFCRHCLALWWESSYKTECPECREKWEGFPKVNILLRCLLCIEDHNDTFPWMLIVSLLCSKGCDRQAVQCSGSTEESGDPSRPQNLPQSTGFPEVLHAAP